MNRTCIAQVNTYTSGPSAKRARWAGLSQTPSESVAEELLFSAASGGDVDLVMQALGSHPEAERDRYPTCFRMILEHSGVDLPHRFGRTLLHDVAAAWPLSAPMGAADRIGFATILLDAGARLDARDDLLRSTPLGWACRWGRAELVTLLLERGADPIEADAEPWATPLARAENMNAARCARAC